MKYNLFLNTSADCRLDPKQQKESDENGFIVYLFCDQIEFIAKIFVLKLNNKTKLCGSGKCHIYL